MRRFVDIAFDCLPLRSVTRLDIPLDASPKYRARCERIKHALETHGSYNSYFLYNASCKLHFTNNPEVGMVEFSFEGTALTDDSDQYTKLCVLDVEVASETCDWLNEPAVAWLKETVTRAVTVEFDRYIAAGDLAQTVKRIERIQSESDQHGGFVGMYL